MPTIITACANRKRHKPVRKLMASTLPRGTVEEVAANWAQRVAAAKPKARAHDLYGGRSFSLARNAAALIGGNFYILSAGLAVVSGEADVPAYDLTVAGSSPNNVLRRIDRAQAEGWWQELCRRTESGTSVKQVVVECPRQILLLSLPAAYLAMVRSDLASIPDADVCRLRIFTGDASPLPERLRRAVMPYDARFDGPDSPIPGTRSDFAARALWHFATKVLKTKPYGDLQSHRRSVTAMVSKLRYPEIPRRRRCSDDELLGLIRDNWQGAGRSKPRLLRLLRDDLGAACEQGRLSRLVAAAGLERSA